MIAGNSRGVVLRLDAYDTDPVPGVLLGRGPQDPRREADTGR